jgi:hypothetical protein
MLHIGSSMRVKLHVSKSWHRLHCTWSFDATYDSTVTSKPQSSVCDHNSQHLRTSSHRYNKVRVGRPVLGGVLVTAAGLELGHKC